MKSDTNRIIYYITGVILPTPPPPPLLINTEYVFFLSFSFFLSFFSRFFPPLPYTESNLGKEAGDSQNQSLPIYKRQRSVSCKGSQTQKQRVSPPPPPPSPPPSPVSRSSAIPSRLRAYPISDSMPPDNSNNSSSSSSNSSGGSGKLAGKGGRRQDDGR